MEKLHNPPPPVLGQLGPVRIPYPEVFKGWFNACRIIILSNKRIRQLVLDPDPGRPPVLETHFLEASQGGGVKNVDKMPRNFFLALKITNLLIFWDFEPKKCLNPMG